MTDSERAGFTLLEVVIALALAGMLLLGARSLLSVTGDGAERVTAEAAAVDRNANAARLLRDLALRAEVRFQDGPRFRGDGRGARWESWCEVPVGWLERCEVTLALLSVKGRRVLTLALPDGTIVPVREGFAEGHILYLRSAADGGAWSASWDSNIAPPLALGLVLDGDTVIVRIGERG
jgi:prepilin-type N-terminal cleavage/methylation domain-containing protein